jgi:hypothetical protein
MTVPESLAWQMRFKFALKEFQFPVFASGSRHTAPGAPLAFAFEML